MLHTTICNLQKTSSKWSSKIFPKVHWRYAADSTWHLRVWNNTSLPVLWCCEQCQEKGNCWLLTADKSGHVVIGFDKSIFHEEIYPTAELAYFVTEDSRFLFHGHAQNFLSLNVNELLAEESFRTFSYNICALNVANDWAEWGIKMSDFLQSAGNELCHQMPFKFWKRTWNNCNLRIGSKRYQLTELKMNSKTKD